ncbi:MAG: tyrosine-type recombinase/integrase [Elusimicrobia bacterium]|nr:tyrosine-type recombinase/integrase [Elusimicrobiota bacterium]
MAHDLLSEFLAFLKTERWLAASTADTYGHHVGGYLKFLQKKDCPTAEASQETIAAYLAHLKARNLRSASIFCAVMAIRNFYRFLIKRGEVAADPTANIRLPTLQSRMVEPLSGAEIERLMSIPPGNGFIGLRDRAILELLYCGLRISEAMGLDIERVHLDEGYVKVLGKGSKDRVVPIGRCAVEATRTYLKKRSQIFPNNNDAVFLSRTGTRLSKGGFWRRFKRHATQAGITRRAYPHLLRHSFAVHLLAGRADLRSLQMLLGHESLAVTQRYLNLDYNTLRETCLKAHPRF